MRENNNNRKIDSTVWEMKLRFLDREGEDAKYIGNRAIQTTSGMCKCKALYYCGGPRIKCQESNGSELEASPLGIESQAIGMENWLFRLNNWHWHVMTEHNNGSFICFPRTLLHRVSHFHMAASVTFFSMG